MKKNVAKMGVLAIAGSALLATTGCGMTTEKIIDKMYDQKMESFSSVSDVDFEFKLSMTGVDVKVGASGEYDMSVEQPSEDEASVYAYVDMTVSALGQKQTIETEVYSLVDGEEVEVYALDPTSDTWMHSVQELENAMMDEAVREDIEKSFRKVLSEAELQKDTEKVDGDVCYVLKLNTNLDAFSEIYEIAYDQANEAADGELDNLLEEAELTNDDIIDLLSYINVDMTIYASKADGYCRRVIVDFTGSDLQGLFDAFCDISGLDPEESFGMEVEDMEFSAFCIDTTISDINDTEVSVPKDVEEEAEDIDVDLDDIVY